MGLSRCLASLPTAISAGLFGAVVLLFLNAMLLIAWKSRMDGQISTPQLLRPGFPHCAKKRRITNPTSFSSQRKRAFVADCHYLCE
jgi:hypothetical protein